MSWAQIIVCAALIVIPFGVLSLGVLLPLILDELDERRKP